MSSQRDDGIPFAVANEQQNLRLMELPPGLLELLTSSNPPKLSIKSRNPTSMSTSDQQAYAVLCTPSQTYQLRQVQTSNSVFVTNSALLYPNETSFPEPGLRAVATCSTTLELHPTVESPRNLLKEILKPYHGPSGNDGRDTDMDIDHKFGMHSILADVPFSEGECAREWINLIAFETDSGCYRPTPQCLLSLWKSILAASFTESIDLGSQFLIDELWKATEDEGYPKPLLISLLRRLQPESLSVDDQWASVDQARCVPWVGELVLEVKTSPRQGLTKSQFLDMWRDALPESWRQHAELERVEHVVADMSSSTISFKDSESAKTTTTTAAAKAGGNRKWHEKFKSMRRG